MEKKRLGKRGMELTIGTIVVIVLAIVVLVVLVVGFTGGWGNLWGNISAFFGGSNVDSIVQACKTACLTNSINAWCYEIRSVKGVTLTGTNCKDLKGETKYGFTDCPAITCA